MERPPHVDFAQTVHPQAWVDESIIVTKNADDLPGVYVMAAAIADPLACESTRDALRALVPARQSRIHWRDEDPGRRSAIVKTIADLDLIAIVTVGTPVNPKKQERARRCCLERLLFEVDRLGVEQVWLEARTESLNQRDRVMVASLRGARVIPAGLRVDFARPSVEPMLWLPDVFAGTVTAARRGRTTWFDTVRAAIDLIEVDVR